MPQKIKFAGGSAMRRSLCFGMLLSAAAFAQEQTTLSISVARQSSQLVPSPAGTLQDIINHNTTANYIATVRNTGNSRAFGVTVTGTVTPTAGIGTVQISAVTPSPGCTIGSDRVSFSCSNVGTLEASLPDGPLPDGGFLPSTTTTVTVTVRLGLPPTSAGCTATMPLGTINATATAANASAVMASASGTTIRPLADLAVSMTGPDSANENDTVAYQITAQNKGPCPSNRVRLGDLNGNSSAGLEWESNSGGCPGGFPCTLGSPWPAGSTVNITATYHVAPLRDTITSLVSTGNFNEMDIASTNTTNPDGGTPLALATLDPVGSNNTAIVETVVKNTSGCSVAGTSTLTLFALAALVGVLRLRRRQ